MSIRVTTLWAWVLGWLLGGILVLVLMHKSIDGVIGDGVTLSLFAGYLTVSEWIKARL